MIRNDKEKTGRPPSFISSFTGYIDQLCEALESGHKSFKKAKALDAETIYKTLTQIRKNSESILFYREQLNKWKRVAQSQSKQQLILILEQKLSKATRLNAEFHALIAAKC